MPQRPDDASQPGPQVDIRVWLPRPVAEWLQEKASESFKPRTVYVKDLLVQLYRRENGGQA